MILRQLNILLTTIGGVTFPNTINAFRSFKKGYKIHICGTDKNENAVGKFFVDKFFKCDDSLSNPNKFANQIIDIIKKNKIDFLIPNGNEDIVALRKVRKRITIPILDSQKTFEKNYFNKKHVYASLINEVPEVCPKYYIFKNKNSFDLAKRKLNFPKKNIILKPLSATGGRGVYELSNQVSKNTFTNRFEMPQIYNSQVLEYLSKKNKKEEILALEKLSKPIISVYSVCMNGQNFFSLSQEREWGSASQTLRGKVAHVKKIEKIASKIIKALNLSYLINMEFGMDKKNQLKLFDLNPRIAASSSVHMDVGINFPQIALSLLMDNKWRPNLKFTKNNFKFYRYFSHIWR
jgi:hypothetical protein